MESPRIERALVSVSDKHNVAEFARSLASAGIELYSTGGSRRHLQSEGLEVHDVADYTGFPEIMDGRVKTLHPKIYGGILSRHDNPTDRKVLEEHGILTFELVVVNLYPFAATIARDDVTWAEAIEQIDIGGPSMVRAAAKNHAFITVATAPDQYDAILEQIASDGCTTSEFRRQLAASAFTHTARYDRAISDYFNRELSAGPFPDPLVVSLDRQATLRYGENPHQQAALYCEPGSESGANLTSARKLNGKELSYNNLLDLDSALTIVRSLPEQAAVVIKHNNPCGAASGTVLAEVARRALDGDPVSAFGSVLGFNIAVDAATAEVLAEPGRFIEAIVAPEFDPEALDILTTRPKWKANVRLMAVGPFTGDVSEWDYRRIDGGFLVQDRDIQADPQEEWRVVTDKQPTDGQWEDLRFAWDVTRHVKSNAILLAKQKTVVGVGAGQMSRVDSVEMAVRKAGEKAGGSVMASDAFFPFPDSIEQAAAAGIAAVIQPGGSRKDDEVIAACNQHGLIMILTGRRHFKH